MKLIAAVDDNWGLGKDGALLFHISADLKHFKRLTEHHTIIYGRKTLETFPGCTPLPDRRNIILSNNTQLGVAAEICGSIDGVLKVTREDDDVFVIGGASVYAALLPFCSQAYITKVYATRPADCHLENLDDNPCWTISDRSGPMNEAGISYEFVTYNRI